LTKYSMGIALLVAASAGTFVYADDKPATQPVVAAVTTAPSADPDKIVFAVGDEKMTAKQFDEFLSDLDARYATAPAQVKRRAAEQLAQMKLLAAEAKKRGLQDSPKVKRQLDLMREEVLAQALVTDMQNNMDDAALQKYYDEHKQQFEGMTKARHILIRTNDSKMPAQPGKKDLTAEQAKAKADDIVKRIKGGENFGDIAKAESDDSGSAVKGGEMDPYGKGAMVPEFEKAAAALKEGETSDPVKSEFGWHIIQAHAVKFEDMKEMLKQQAGPTRMQETVDALKKSGNIKLDEGFFGPPQSQPSPQDMPPGHPRTNQ